MPSQLKIQAVNFATMRHIERVRNLLNRAVVQLLERGEAHDQSKLEEPEASAFAVATDKLAGLTYGTPEYDAAKDELGTALAHHYANNRHHPEWHKNGVDDMDLIDLLEMFVDWQAASERHADGNIRKSIEINGRRFNMSSQLVRIFENTVDSL